MMDTTHDVALANRQIDSYLCSITAEYSRAESLAWTQTKRGCVAAVHRGKLNSVVIGNWLADHTPQERYDV